MQHANVEGCTHSSTHSVAVHERAEFPFSMRKKHAFALFSTKKITKRSRINIFFKQSAHLHGCQQNALSPHLSHFCQMQLFFTSMWLAWPANLTLMSFMACALLTVTCAIDAMWLSWHSLVYSHHLVALHICVVHLHEQMVNLMEVFPAQTPTDLIRRACARHDTRQRAKESYEPNISH
jgi:hypothetical protein